MINYLKRKIFEETDKKLSLSFSRVSGDINNLQKWVSYLNEQDQKLYSAHDRLHRTHAEHTTLTKRDISNLNKWLSFLNQHNSELAQYLKQSAKNQLFLYDEIQKLKKNLENTEKNAKVTPGHASDTQVTSSDTQVTRKSDVSLQLPKGITGSEKKVLSALYKSDSPMTYEKIARELNLNYSTVKNIIYHFRKKGIGIKDAVNAYGEKEFFLNSAAKIEVSGR